MLLEFAVGAVGLGLVDLFGLGCRGLDFLFFGLWKRGEGFVEECVDAVSVLGGYGNKVLNTQAAEVFGSCIKGFGIHFVYGEEDWLAGAEQQTGEIEIRRGELGAAIDDHDDGVRFGKCGPRLAKDFSGDQGFVIGNDAARVDEAGGASGPFDLTVNAVAGDTGFVSDDGAARAREPVEERGLADVRASHDSQGWLAGCGRLGRVRGAIQF